MTTEQYYISEALRYAKRHSHDTGTQVGAVLVAEKKLVFGANHVPVFGAWPKDAAMEHAERAVIYKAAACGIPTAGATLYAPWFACHDCARAIILAGIREVVGLLSLRAATPERWRARLETAYAMLDRAGVQMRFLAGDVGEAIVFDGRAFQC